MLTVGSLRKFYVKEEDTNFTTTVTTSHGIVVGLMVVMVAAE